VRMSSSDRCFTLSKRSEVMLVAAWHGRAPIRDHVDEPSSPAVHAGLRCRAEVVGLDEEDVHFSKEARLVLRSRRGSGIELLAGGASSVAGGDGQAAFVIPDAIPPHP